MPEEIRPGFDKNKVKPYFVALKSGLSLIFIGVNLSVFASAKESAVIIAAILLVLSNILRTFAKVLSNTVMAIIIFSKTCKNIFITI